MAHEMTRRDSAAYVREPAWHGLGTVLATPPATIEDALQLAGLTWRVESAPVAVAGRNVPGYQATVRSDTREVLGVMSDAYRIAQNVEAFGVLRGAMKGGAEIETLGSVRGGRLIYATVRLRGADFDLGGASSEAHQGFGVVVARHDGGGAVRAFASPVRVVCMNTIRAAIAGAEAAEEGTAEAGVKVAHRGDMTQALKASDALLSRLLAESGKIRAQVETLAARRIDPAAFGAYVAKIVPPPIAPNPDAYGTDADGIRAFDDARAKYERARDRWQALRAGIGATMNNANGTIGPEIAGTWYAAYAAATEYLQHGDGAPSEAKAASIMFGAGADRTRKAMTEALEMSGAAT